MVLIMEYEKSEGVSHSAAKRKVAQSIEEAAIKVVGVLDSSGTELGRMCLMMKRCLLR